MRIEHCIGLLKNRFQSLRNIRTIISSSDDMRRIIDRVRVCVVLHNMLIGSTFPSEWVEPNDEDMDEDGAGNNIDDEENNNLISRHLVPVVLKLDFKSEDAYRLSLDGESRGE